MKYLGFIWGGLLVEDLEASVCFYRDVLGLKLLGKGEDWAHFDAGGRELLELMSGGKAAPLPKLRRSSRSSSACGWITLTGRW